MSDTEAITPKTKAEKPWTLMFFVASDNTLSPSAVPQLKAIKAAGRSDKANVLVYFDPNQKGAPTRVYAINDEPAPATGGSSEPVITVLSSDYLKPEEIQPKGPESKAFVESLIPPVDKLTSVSALEQFLGFCHETYPAEHYMLFLVGHGMVVGRDAFLPDDNPDSAIGLETLGLILNRFKTKIGKGKLELIGMHSCSMSAIEVAYELQDTARYMLASEGLSFVGSWPYRQLLTKIYNEIALPGEPDIDALVRHLHTLCIHYSVDFMHAGYSSDMTLTSLEEPRVKALTKPISDLSQALQEGMKIPRCRDLIVLAHWRSQSYWQETYTDLCDFCLCLTRLCKDEFKGPTFDEDVKRNAIISACKTVIEILKPENVNGPVVCTEYVGPDVQFSHGLSIYFPWSDPVEDENDKVVDLYAAYAFTKEVKKLSATQTWLRFLTDYFDKTKRPDRVSEERRADPTSKFGELDYQSVIGNLRLSFPAITATSTRDFYPTSALEGKITPSDSTGGACSCASMKNYSRNFSLSPGAATVFNNTNLMTATASGDPGQTSQTGQTNPSDQTNPKGGTQPDE